MAKDNHISWKICYCILWLYCTSVNRQCVIPDYEHTHTWEEWNLVRLIHCNPLVDTFASFFLKVLDSSDSLPMTCFFFYWYHLEKTLDLFRRQKYLEFSILQRVYTWASFFIFQIYFGDIMILRWALSLVGWQQKEGLVGWDWGKAWADTAHWRCILLGCMWTLKI